MLHIRHILLASRTENNKNEIEKGKSGDATWTCQQ